VPRKMGLGYFRWFAVVAMGVASICLRASPAQRLSADAGDIEVQVGKTVEISSSFRFCWYPTVSRFSTGELMVTIRMSPDEGNPEGDFSAYCISKDRGLTWSRRYTMGAGANVDSAYLQDPLKDGAILRASSVAEAYPAGQAQQFHFTLTKFSRGGMEVHQVRDAIVRLSQPVHMGRNELDDRRVPDTKFLDNAGLALWGSIITGLKGELLTLVEYSAARDPQFSRLALARSVDGGQTWEEYSTVAAVKPNEKPWPGMGQEGPNEGGLVRLADNRLYVIFRTAESGFMGQAWSSDDGRTWTPPVSLPFKGVALRIRRLSNGVLACTTGRPGPVVVMFSVDGTGEKWSHITPIFSDMSTRYTDFIELEPGKLLVVYDSVPYGWQRIPYSDTTSKNRIYGTFVEVEKK
jgi:hypothetical protein